MTVCVIALSGTIAVAQAETTATTSPAVQNYITQLQLLRQLRQGMSGDDVKVLQNILAGDPDVYPEGLITGTFGPLTSKAVKKFQEKFGLESVGNVGPKTLKKLKEIAEGRGDDNEQGDHRPCMAVPPGHLIAPGLLRKHDDERIRLQNGTTTMGTTTVGTTTATSTLPVLPPCQRMELPRGIEKKIGSSTPDVCRKGDIFNRMTGVRCMATTTSN